jgi:hypothetical protein
LNDVFFNHNIYKLCDFAIFVKLYYYINIKKIIISKNSLIYLALIDQMLTVRCVKALKV